MLKYLKWLFCSHRYRAEAYIIGQQTIVHIICTGCGQTYVDDCATTNRG